MRVSYVSPKIKANATSQVRVSIRTAGAGATQADEEDVHGALHQERGRGSGEITPGVKLHHCGFSGFIIVVIRSVMHPTIFLPSSAK